MPTSHQFYVYIENLFHNRVTVGYQDGDYHPTDPITRAQMAVFLLKGKFGLGSRPAAGDRHGLQRRSRRRLRCGLDRRAREPADHGGLWQRELLPERSRDARRDGRVPSQVRARLPRISPRPARASLPMSRARAARASSTPTGSRSSTPKPSPPDACRPRREACPATARTLRTPGARWRSSSSGPSGSSSTVPRGGRRSALRYTHRPGDRDSVWGCGSLEGPRFPDLAESDDGPSRPGRPGIPER